MKYVRTKDGIYEVKDDFIILKSQELYLPHFKDHVIAEAETIEELCDEFVVDFNGKKIISALPFEKSLDYGGDELYGAIWTEKGLIYVAKMNSKGELELL